MNSKKHQQQTNNKHWKPKNQWTTDFVDRSMYKLSQIEMIQKKAALQSKHRQQAKQLLDERRKKLQMGVIDDDTRPIYQTALMSKKIDLNPPIRRNLSQMIEYEKSFNKKQNHQLPTANQFQEQLKNTKAFIKKAERANKQIQINRAVEILQDKFTIKQPKSQYILNSKSTQQFNGQQEQTLCQIQDTIRFMEQKLFQKNNKKQQPSQQNNNDSSINQNKQTQQMVHSNNIDISFAEKGSFSIYQNKQEIQFSRLKLDRKQQQLDCMDTIRRMREMIESKQHLYNKTDEYGQKQNIQMFINRQNQFICQNLNSEAQIDFSLTLNHDQQQANNKLNDHYISNYQEIKKSLFQEVNQLKNWSLDTQSQINELDCKKYVKQQKKQIKKNKNKQQRPSQTNSQLQKIKNLVNGTKKNVQGIKIQTIGLPKSTDIGFDFRGSINIRKNLINK